MNVIILAAGTDSILGNMTKSTPKPMLPVKGIPLMEHNILLCKKYGLIKYLLISTIYQK